MRWGIAAVAGMLALGSARSALAADPWFDAAWKTRQRVWLTEPGVAARTDEYVDLTIDTAASPSATVSADLRVLTPSGAPVPAFVRKIAGTKITIVLNRSVGLGATETVYVYWGNAAATAPVQTFPKVRYALYAFSGPSVLLANEAATQGALNALQPYGRLSLEGTLLAGRSGYDRSVAQAHRFAVPGPACAVSKYLSLETTFLQDIALFGMSDGTCVLQDYFGVFSAVPRGQIMAPANLGYVAQDLTTSQPLGVACSCDGNPGPTGTVELSTTTDFGCLIRWDAGSNPLFKLRYRAFYSGLMSTAWTPEYTTAMRRAVESMLQDNRITTALVGAPEFLCNGQGRAEPKGPERCDGVDNDCNGVVDDGADALCAGVATGARCLGGVVARCGCATDADCTLPAAPACDAFKAQCTALPVVDAGATDAGTNNDASVTPDAGVALDAGPNNSAASVDAGGSAALPAASDDAGCSCTAGAGRGEVPSAGALLLGIAALWSRRRRGHTCCGP
jgi:MYXO-CTERM domain-containing protein